MCRFDIEQNKKLKTEQNYGKVIIRDHSESMTSGASLKLTLPLKIDQILVSQLKSPTKTWPFSRKIWDVLSLPPCKFWSQDFESKTEPPQVINSEWSLIFNLGHQRWKRWNQSRNLITAHIKVKEPIWLLRRRSLLRN